MTTKKIVLGPWYWSLRACNRRDSKQQALSQEQEVQRSHLEPHAQVREIKLEIGKTFYSQSLLPMTHGLQQDQSI